MEEIVIEGVLKDEEGGMVLLSDTFEEYIVPTAVEMAIADDVLQSCSLPRRMAFIKDETEDMKMEFIKDETEDIKMAFIKEETEDIKNEFNKEEFEEIKIEETFSVKHEETEEQTGWFYSHS
ncbi:hypothetical protein DPX16_5535 [Anabarilius grahami]|uniref:Uncharacterized protein n=1 Tax=Anabarilius grahami TaxID=495550 RepID=A0A3N0Y9T0_ANAGA|nr:hypothetical protein DPX16_5535 [Anabarilius grahami]